MTVNTITITGEDYVVYASVAEADRILSVDPVRSTLWATLDDDAKGKMLVAATARLDQLSWKGTKVGGNAQENAWYRTGATWPDGEVIADNELPYLVERATALLAGTIAIDAKKAEAGTSGSNIKAVGAGSARVEFFRPTDGVAVQDETAFNLIKGFLQSSSGVGYGVASGTCDTVLDSGYGKLSEPFA